MFKKSGNPKVEELNKSWTERSYNLSCLQAIKIEGEKKRKCAWCAEGILTHGNQKYCEEECSRSAMAWAYPQKEDALRYLLEAQGWCCKLCKFSYVETLKELCVKDRFRDKGAEPTLEEIAKLPWYYFKRLKARVPKERRPEVDHIHPISKGGQAIGLDNHQAICYTCHKVKTSVDNSGKRKKKD